MKDSHGGCHAGAPQAAVTLPAESSAAGKGEREQLLLASAPPCPGVAGGFCPMLSSAPYTQPCRVALCDCT